MEGEFPDFRHRVRVVVVAAVMCGLFGLTWFYLAGMSDACQAELGNALNDIPYTGSRPPQC